MYETLNIVEKGIEKEKMGWAESKGREKEKLSNLATSNSIQI